LKAHNIRSEQLRSLVAFGVDYVYPELYQIIADCPNLNQLIFYQSRSGERVEEKKDFESSLNKGCNRIQLYAAEHPERHLNITLYCHYIVHKREDVTYEYREHYSKITDNLVLKVYSKSVFHSRFEFDSEDSDSSTDYELSESIDESESDDHN